MSDREPDPAAPWHRPALLAVMVAGMLTGVVLVALAFTLGRCDAFGGPCPADTPGFLEDDVFGMAAVGAALLAGMPAFLLRPSRQRLLIALGVGVVSALVVGLIARSAAYG